VDKSSLVKQILAYSNSSVYLNLRLRSRPVLQKHQKQTQQQLKHTKTQWLSEAKKNRGAGAKTEVSTASGRACDSEALFAAAASPAIPNINFERGLFLVEKSGA
jgi:hypothetical protein